MQNQNKKEVYKMEIYRNEIYLADLGKCNGSIQAEIRPVVIIQNNKGNKYSPTTIIAPITSRLEKSKIPTHVYITHNKLEKNSLILCEQIQTINKTQLLKRISKIMNFETQEKINNAIKISLDLEEDYARK